MLVEATGAQGSDEVCLVSDNTGLVAPSVILNEIILYACSVYIYTVHSIATVLLSYSIIYLNGMNIVTYVIFLFLMLLFLTILDNKLLLTLYSVVR